MRFRLLHTCLLPWLIIWPSIQAFIMHSINFEFLWCKFPPHVVYRGKFLTNIHKIKRNCHTDVHIMWFEKKNTASKREREKYNCNIAVNMRNYCAILRNSALDAHVKRATQPENAKQCFFSCHVRHKPHFCNTYLTVHKIFRK